MPHTVRGARAGHVCRRDAVPARLQGRPPVFCGAAPAGRPARREQLLAVHFCAAGVVRLPGHQHDVFGIDHDGVLTRCCVQHAVPCTPTAASGVARWRRADAALYTQRQYASVFQMLRGSVVVFTGILSVIFLKRRLRFFHWLGMTLVCSGALVVGSSSLSAPASTDDSSHPAVLAPSNPLLGNILIVCAQVWFSRARSLSPARLSFPPSL